MVDLNEAVEMKIQKHDLDVTSIYVNHTRTVNLDSL